MRAHRILYAVSAVFLYFFWMLYGGAIPKLMFFAAAAPFVVSLALTLLCRFGIRVTQTDEEEKPVKGQTSYCSVSIENLLPIPLFYLSAEFGGDPLVFEEGLRHVRFSLKPREKMTLRFEIKCRYRGRFRVGLSRMFYDDFFGLVRLRRRFASGRGLLIYPRIVPIDGLSADARLPHDNRDAAGGLNVNITSVRDIRQYRHGDTIRFAHWKLSAKRGEILLKEFERTSSESVLFLFDMTPSAEERAVYIPKQDVLIEAAVSAACWLLEENATCRFVLPQGTRTDVFDALRREDFAFVYEQLAQADFDAETDFTRMLTDHLVTENFDRSVYIFSASPGEASLRLINEAAFKGFDIHLYTAGEPLKSAADQRVLKEDSDVKDVLEGKVNPLER